MPNTKAWRLHSRKNWADSSENQFDVQGVMLQRGQTFTFVRQDGTTYTDEAILEERSLPMQKPGTAGVWVSVRVLALVGFRGVTGKTDFQARKQDQFRVGNQLFRITDISDVIPHQRIATVESVE